MTYQARRARIAAVTSFATITCLAAIATAQENVVRKPLAIGTKIETGQVVKGVPNKTGEDADKSYLSRMAVSLTQEVVVDDRIEIKAGVGGVFFSLFPDVPGQAQSQGIKFGPGITQAQVAYKLGEDVKKPWGVLRAGFFPYKYNADAKNLGEYLLRSMPYPTFVMTGGWSITDNAFVRAQGLQATFYQFDGSLKHDFLLTTERDFRPAGNFTPTYIAEYTKGPFQVGGGVSLFHYLPLDASRLKNRDMGNYSIYRYDDLPAFTVYVDPLVGDSLETPYHHAGGTLYISAQEVNGIRLEVPSVNWDSLAPYRDTMSYHTQGVKLMARASFSPQAIYPLPMLNPNDLKIYAELALLGVENQPALYEDRLRRMPLMVGVNLPTFRLLDYLSFEMEYFASRLPDDWERVQYENIPSFESYSVVLADTKRYRNTSDNWKWSLYASKSLTTGVSIRGQIANDHFRSIDQATLNFSGRPALYNPSDWYYIIALNLAI